MPTDHSPALPPHRSPGSRAEARKLALGCLLAVSVVFFFLILAAGGLALLHEAAPRETVALMRVVRHLAHHVAHRH